MNFGAVILERFRLVRARTPQRVAPPAEPVAPPRASRVGILGLSRRVGTFSEVGLRSWDEAGCQAVEEVLATAGESVFFVHRPLVIHVSPPQVQRVLRDWCDAPHLDSRCDLVLTVGGTGYTSQDVVPEATLAVLHRVDPPIPQLLRIAAYDAGQPQGALSRGVAGLRRRTLLINLPGDARGMADQDCLRTATQALLPHLPGILAALRG